jgi:predicted RNase H-like HicB family nuclease
MNNSYSAIIKKEGQWWIGWIVEIPGVNCQERTQKKLLESLRSALQEALELNRQDAIIEAGEDYKEEKIAL